LCKRFAKTWFKTWRVVNIDKEENPDCNKNFIIDFDKPISSDQMLELNDMIKETAPEIDAIINVVSLPKRQEKLMIGSANIFEEFENMRNTEIQSSLLLTHLASKHLSPNGFVGYNGGSSELLNGSPHYINSLERIAYATQIKQGLDLSTDR
jgi:hypothetical protein